LSGKKTLDKNEGMLFDYKSNPQIVFFWMKDMRIPIDIIWISNYKIVKIDDNTPVSPLGISDSNLTKYSSNVPIDYVLEVNGGFSEKNNIKVGDNVKI
jgi:uncharacterized membrane protein (UPF0127 family)